MQLYWTSYFFFARNQPRAHASNTRWAVTRKCYSDVIMFCSYIKQQIYFCLWLLG